MPHDTEALYREHGAAVAKLCRSLLRDRAEAEDAAQQVFLSAHRALLDGTTPREPLAWLLAVARNECYARFRRRSTAPLPVGEAPEGTAADASVHVLRAGELAGVWDEVGRMPPAQREAFLLREIRGLSYGQLADELSLSPPSVRSLLLRARTRLRRRLRDVALGGAPWLQALARLAGGGDGASPVPAATKAAAAAGLGALALVGGGDVPRPVPHRSAAPARVVAVKHRTAARVRHLSAPPRAVAVMPHAHRSGIAEAASEPEHPKGRGDRSGPDRSSGRDGSGSSDLSQSGRDGDSGSDAVETTPATQTTGDGRDGGGGSTSSGPGPGGSSSSSSDGGGPGPSSGSDGGGGSDGGSGSSGSDGGGSGSSDGG